MKLLVLKELHDAEVLTIDDFNQVGAADSV